MKVIKTTYFPIVLKGAIRTTQNMLWLTKISEEAAIALDKKWTKALHPRLGDIWVCFKKDKNGNTKEFARKSPPSYERQRRYLIEQYNVSNEIEQYAKEIGFIMPEDDFMLLALMPMPKSWTKKKKLSMSYQLHKQKPDADNIFKKLSDAMFKKDTQSANFRNDACISSFGVVKLYVPDGHPIGFKIIEFEKGYFRGLAEIGI